MASSSSSSAEAVRKQNAHKLAPTQSAREVQEFDHISDDADFDIDYHGHLRNVAEDSPKDEGFTRNDKKDMKRMGKSQELRRNFRPLSALAFTVILQGTWEVLLAASTQGLVDGGLAGLFWSYLWTFGGMMLVNVSLAEMASMAPTSGGQYHWVSEFAPPKYQKMLSYMTGWMSTLSWQAGAASGPFLVGTIIQSLILVNDSSYAYPNWHGTMLTWGVAILVALANIYGGMSSRDEVRSSMYIRFYRVADNLPAMPVFQNLMLILHVFGFLTIIVCFWVLAPRNSAEVVFTQFTNGGGWSSMGLSLMIGQITALYACICSDAAAHMSEEIKDAGVTVPRAMVGSYVLNGALGMVFLISFLFCIVDLDGALNDETGYPFLFVFKNAFSLAAVNALSAIVCVLIFAGTLSYNLSTSRQTWAFARDNGLPFSNWIARVNPTLEVPANAVIFTSVVIFVLSLIYIGSDAAFNAIISLNLVSLMITYMTSIACVLYRRIYQPELLPKCRWSLGTWGVPINASALAYVTFTFFWCFWPNATPVTADGFNWSVVMFVAVFVGAIIDYAIRGRHVYKGPVVLTDTWRD